MSNQHGALDAIVWTGRRLARWVIAILGVIGGLALWGMLYLWWAGGTSVAESNAHGWVFGGSLLLTIYILRWWGRRYIGLT